jgi:serine/threonine protein kinase
MRENMFSYCGQPLYAPIATPSFMTDPTRDELPPTQPELPPTQPEIPPTRENLGEDEQGGLFGRLAVSLGYCEADDIAAALTAMVEAASTGAPPRLGEVLVDHGALTPNQVANVLHQQARVLLRCENCGHQFNADVKDDATLPVCPKCGGTLSVPTDLTHVGVEETIDPDPLRTMDLGPDGDDLGDGGGQSYTKMEGSTLGPYRVGRKPVALKVLPADLSHEKDRVRRFLREAESMARVRHPNIVQVLNVGSDRDLYYIAMEQVEGGDLGKLISDDQLLEVPEAIRLIMETARGLAAAHNQGLIHRDIKPDNVLLTPDGTPKVADFGLAKAVEGVEGATQLTGANAIMGTPSYMSPEQVNGDPADARSDVYSLGVLFFELLTGERPFNAAQPMAVMIMHLRDDAPPPRKLRPEIPQSISNVVERMLAKEPAERYESAQEFVDAMLAIERGEEIAYTARRIRKRRARVLIATLVLLALGAGGGLIFNQLSGKGIETHQQRVQRLEGEAIGAYIKGDDDAASAAVVKLLRLEPAHAEGRRLQGRIELMATADGAWRTGDVAATLVALAPAVNAGDKDERVSNLHTAATAFQAALAALQQRDLAAADLPRSSANACATCRRPSTRAPRATGRKWFRRATPRSRWMAATRGRRSCAPKRATRS